MAKEERFASLMEFYPYYLTEHSNLTNRILQVCGTGIVISLLITGILLEKYKLLIFMPLAGYGFAWFGHFMIEKNRKPFRVIVKDAKFENGDNEVNRDGSYR
jgi:hypothetical protein